MDKPRRIFLVGLPYSGKSELIATVKQEFLTQGVSVKELDFRSDLKKKFKVSDQQLFITMHFEHGLNDHRLNQEKIEILQKLIKTEAHIIISSTVQTSAMLEFYESARKRIDPQKSDELRKEWTEYKHAIRIWKNILSGFTVLYQPLNKALPKTSPEDLRAYFDEKPFAKSELLHGHYLRNVKSLLEKEPCKTYEEKENYVLRVEEVAETYYQSLWNALLNSEKHLLYDLAKDRFVNFRNLTAIRSLMQKGVIVVEDTLTIMNKSFNNFILSVVNEDEEVRMEKELQRKGSWSMVRAVIIITLIGLATFITLAEQNLLRDFNLLLGAIGSAAALLTRFGGLFSSGIKTKE